MGWNRGFSLVADLNKGCFLLTVLKRNFCQGVWSFVGLNTNILKRTSVLNCQTLNTLFLQLLVIKRFFQENWVLYIFLLYLWVKYELIWSDITAQTVNLGSNLLVKAQTIPQNVHRELFIWPKVAFTKDIYILSMA